jgi:hypothetical protein
MVPVQAGAQGGHGSLRSGGIDTGVRAPGPWRIPAHLVSTHIATQRNEDELTLGAACKEAWKQQTEKNPQLAEFYGLQWDPNQLTPAHLLLRAQLPAERTKLMLDCGRWTIGFNRGHTRRQKLLMIATQHLKNKINR